MPKAEAKPPASTKDNSDLKELVDKLRKERNMLAQKVVDLEKRANEVRNSEGRRSESPSQVQQVDFYGNASRPASAASTPKSVAKQSSARGKVIHPFEEQKPVNPFEQERSVAQILRQLRKLDIGFFKE